MIHEAFLIGDLAKLDTFKIVRFRLSFGLANAVLEALKGMKRKGRGIRV